MERLVKIPINEASNKQLLFYAQRVLGLDVNKGANNSTIIAKIESAQPGTTEIDVEETADMQTNASSGDTLTPAAADVPEDTHQAAHFRHDPKVTVRISPTSDKTRAKDVQIAVNGDVVIVKRGAEVPIPYRHYLALRDAVEKVGRETDEINPKTHMPIIEWVDLPSYEYSVLRMPTDAEIADFHKRTDAAFA